MPSTAPAAEGGPREAYTVRYKLALKGHWIETGILEPTPGRAKYAWHRMSIGSYECVHCFPVRVDQ